MKALYFDCFSGVSGDMILGALAELGAPLEILLDGLKAMGIEGVSIRKEEVTRCGIPGTKIIIETSDSRTGRGLAEILSVIDKSSLPQKIKDESKEIFNLLGSVEARIHGVEPAHVHFHELGGLDSIIDIVGAVLFLNFLGVEFIASSPLPSGRGFVSTCHGQLPVPAPATAALLEGVPVVFGDSECELVTPTGIAILKGIVGKWGGAPAFAVEKVGYGAGGSERKTIPNLLRVFLGEIDAAAPARRTISILETNIDDMNPQVSGHLVEALLENGAREAFLTSVVMKKGRPGILLTVLCDEAKEEPLTRLIFKETTTLGIRMRKEERVELEREIVLVETEFGRIRVKTAKRPDGEITFHPEFDDCLAAAKAHGVSILKILGSGLHSSLKGAGRRTE